MRTITRLIAGFGILVAIIGSLNIWGTDLSGRETGLMAASVLSTIVFCSLAFVICQSLDTLIEIRDLLKVQTANDAATKSDDSNDGWRSFVGAEVVVDGPESGPLTGRLVRLQPDPHHGWVLYLESPNGPTWLRRDEIQNISLKLPTS